MKARRELLWNQIKETVKGYIPNINLNQIDLESYLCGKNLFSDDDYLYIAFSPFKNGKFIEYGGPFFKKNVKIFYSSYEEFEKAFSQYKRDIDFFLQNKNTPRILQSDKYSIKEKLEKLYEAQENYYALMAEFERGMRFIFKEYDIPYFSLDNIIGTRGEGIESVGIAMTELGKEMEKAGLDWENDDLDKDY